MEITLDCLPCMLKQVTEASKMATDDTSIHEKIMLDAIGVLSDYKSCRCSPELAEKMHGVVKRHSKNRDPYAAVKLRDIKSAVDVYPLLKSYLQGGDGDLYRALKIAATGNIIDSAIYSSVNIKGCVEDELQKGFVICDIESLEDKLKRAKTLLIIGDNAGETVFDKVLAEYLLRFKISITYAVRSAPIINDATVKEAYESGLDCCADIISTGCGAPGAILEKCGDEFVSLFNSSDLVISKGQGNYEALSDCERNIYFLLKAKCPVISKKLGIKTNDYALYEINKERGRF